MKEIKLTVSRMDLSPKEHDYIIDCLKSALAYCKEQYNSSGIDWLPTINFIGLQDEAEKFELLDMYLCNIRLDS